MAVNGTARDAIPFHPTPCPELIRERDERREVEDKLFAKIDDPDNGLGAHTQALKNNVRQMDRIETAVGELRSGLAAVNDRIDRLTLLLVGTLATALITLASTLIRVGKL